VGDAVCGAEYGQRSDERTNRRVRISRTGSWSTAAVPSRPWSPW